MVIGCYSSEPGRTKDTKPSKCVAQDSTILACINSRQTSKHRYKYINRHVHRGGSQQLPPPSLELVGVRTKKKKVVTTNS